MNAWTPHAHSLLGTVVVVVAFFQGVGVEAPRAAALRRRAAEAPLVVSRQALASAERAAGASHHLESSIWLRRSGGAARSLRALWGRVFSELAYCKDTSTYRKASSYPSPRLEWPPGRALRLWNCILAA